MFGRLPWLQSSGGRPCPHGKTRRVDLKFGEGFSSGRCKPPHNLLAPRTIRKTPARTLAPDLSPSFFDLYRLCHRLVGHHTESHAAPRTSSPRAGGDRRSLYH